MTTIPATAHTAAITANTLRQELRLLVEALGFSVTRLYTKVTGSIKIEGLSIKRFRGLIQLLTAKNRGSNIFLLARKEAGDRTGIPRLALRKHACIRT